MKIDKYKDFYMGVAELAAQQSVAKRLKVGCCIVTESGAIYSGWNGTYPDCWTNECEFTECLEDGAWIPFEEIPQWDFKARQFRIVTRPEVLHAERNALDKMLAEGVRSKGAVVFITHSPCTHCALALIGAKINKVFYKDVYRDTSGRTMLVKAGIQVEMLKD